MSILFIEIDTKNADFLSKGKHVKSGQNTIGNIIEIGISFSISQCSQNELISFLIR